MYRTNVKYEDFNGNPVTRQLCFHLSTNGKIKINKYFGGEAGFEELRQKALANKDPFALYDLIDTMIRFGYCLPADDGESFATPTDAELDRFMNSLAHDALIEKLINADDIKELEKFLNGVTGSKIDLNSPEVKEQAKAELRKAGLNPDDYFKDGKDVVDAEFTEQNAGAEPVPENAVPLKSIDYIDPAEQSKDDRIAALEKELAQLKSGTQVLSKGITAR